MLLLPGLRDCKHLIHKFMNDQNYSSLPKRIKPLAYKALHLLKMMVTEIEAESKPNFSKGYRELNPGSLAPPKSGVKVSRKI